MYKLPTMDQSLSSCEYLKFTESWTEGRRNLSRGQSNQLDGLIMEANQQHEFSMKCHKNYTSPCQHEIRVIVALERDTTPFPFTRMFRVSEV